MSQNPRFDCLFQPIQIGPVTAKNRFMQTPHGNGHGWRDPHGGAAWRGMRAEGGWGIVNTEQVEFHPSSDTAPLSFYRLCDDKDIPMVAQMADAVHEHAALAGIELCYNSISQPGYGSRIIPYAASTVPMIDQFMDPFQARAMDKEDIRNFLRWQRNAAIRAKTAGFDLIYVYGASMLGLPFIFMSKRTNHRTDEYGGSLKNRVRLLKQMIEVTKDAVGDTCAVPVRTSVDELMGSEGWHREEVLEMFDYMGEDPDMWDLTLSDWSHDTVTSRFGEEGAQEPFVAGLKQHTGKPVVGVGRFTSPDTMVSQIRRGVLDIIGAARAAIADPFLPNKIKADQTDDIRECIGCNICVFHEDRGVPARCTQNPTAGEEWRKGWHPEKVQPAKSKDSVLVVGAGPAGLEAARTLGQRGYQVLLAEATTELGGRVTKEAKLPGLSAWIRVAEYRTEQLNVMPNVDIYLDNKLSADDILGLEIPHVGLATGATWRRDGIGRSYLNPEYGLSITEGAQVLSPTDILDGTAPEGKNVVVFDDDYYYMANCVAEKLRLDGYDVTLVCSSNELSPWTHSTLENDYINKQMAMVGVNVITGHVIKEVKSGMVTVEQKYTTELIELLADATVLVTGRTTNSEVYNELMTRQGEWAEAGIKSVREVGDTYAPGIIAQAVYDGHKYAQEMDEPDLGDKVPYRRSIVTLEAIDDPWAD